MGPERRSVELTQARIAQFVTRACDYFIPDSVSPILALRVYPSGRRHFYVLYARAYIDRATGKRRSKILLKIGNADPADAGFVSLPAARALADALHCRLAEGADPWEALESVRKSAPRRPPPRTRAGRDGGAGSVIGLVLRYFAERSESWATKTSRGNASIMYRHIIPTLEALAVRDLTTAHIKATLNSCATAGTQDHVRIFLKSFIAWAKDCDFIGADVGLPERFRKAAPGKKLVSRAPLAPGELQVVLKESNRILNEPTAPDWERRKAGYMMTLAYTGMRADSVIGIRRHQIHAADGRTMGYAKIAAAHFKSIGKVDDFSIAIAPGLERVLSTLPVRPDGSFFAASENSSWQAHWRRERLEPLMGRAFDQHSFRSTFESRITELGVSYSDAHIMTGHDPKMMIGPTVRMYNLSQHAIVFRAQWMKWGSFLDWLIFAAPTALVAGKPFIDSPMLAAFETWALKRKPALTGIT